MTEPQQFQKKPVKIWAMQWPAEDGGSYAYRSAAATIHRWVNDNGGKTTVVTAGEDIYPAIVTLEGTMRIGYGDFVIRGVQGEFYPCKPDIFAATYDAV